ncbi:hypothetical protein ACFSTC_30495 [Nonomuraea ferruginea]
MTVPSGSASVTFDLVRLSHRHGHHVQALLPEQVHELPSLVAAERHHGARGDRVGQQGAGDVHALAAGVEAGGGGADDRAAVQRGDLDRAVQAGIERQGHDHARTT